MAGVYWKEAFNKNVKWLFLPKSEVPRTHRMGHLEYSTSTERGEASASVCLRFPEVQQNIHFERGKFVRVLTHPELL